MNNNKTGFIIGLSIFLLIWLGFQSYLLSFDTYMRTQHFGGIKVYAEQGVDLLLTPVLSMGENNFVVNEFALFQAMLTPIYKIVNGNIFYLRLFTILFSILASWLFFDILNILSKDKKTALVGTLLFLSSTLVMAQFSMLAADFFAYVMALLMFWSWLKIKSNRWWLILFGISSIFATLIKLPYVLPIFISISLYILIEKKNPVYQLIKDNWTFGLVAFLSLFVLIIWKQHGEIYNSSYPTTAFLSDPNFVKHWYFGELSTRLEPGRWASTLWWINANVFSGNITIPLLALFGFLVMPEKKMALSLVFGPIITTLIFFYIITQHQHYYFIFLLPVFYLAGYGLKYMWENYATNLSMLGKNSIVVAILILLPISGIYGFYCSTYPLMLDSHYKKVAEELKRYISIKDKILVHPRWTHPILIHNDFKGLSILYKHMIDTQEEINYYKSKGYNYLVVINSSPIEYGKQINNPGGAGTNKMTFEEFIPNSSTISIINENYTIYSLDK